MANYQQGMCYSGRNNAGENIYKREREGGSVHVAPIYVTGFKKV